MATAVAPGRRRDEILLVVGDQPAILGFRARTLLFAMLIGFMIGALYYSRLLNLVFGSRAWAVSVLMLVGTLLFAKYMETLEDELFLVFAVRFYVRRCVGWARGRYCGAAPSRVRAHVLDDVLTAARLSRLGGIKWEQL